MQQLRGTNRLMQFEFVGFTERWSEGAEQSRDGKELRGLGDAMHGTPFLVVEHGRPCAALGPPCRPRGEALSGTVIVPFDLLGRAT